MKKIKYYFNNLTISGIILILISIFLFMSSANGEPFNDNITYSQNKTIKIQDDLNFPLINEYSYQVYVNNSFIGNYKRDEIIFVPDNSTINIYVPSPIKTNFIETWDIAKTQLLIAFMWIITIFAIIILIIILYKKAMR